MTVFVTGASGFIGSRVVSMLEARGHSVYALKAKLSEIDAVRQELTNANPDVVIDLAWQGIPDLGKTMSALNRDQHIEFLRAVAERGVPKVIVAGSSYQRPGVAPSDHTAFIAAKDAIRDEGKQLIAQAGGIFIWTYPFFVYGPGKRSGSLIPSLIRMGKEGHVPAAKNSDAWHDFVYVDDVAEALVLLAEKDVLSGEFDIGSGTLARTGDIASMVARMFDKTPVPIEECKAEGRKADIAPLTAATGWEPRTALETGVRAMIED